MFLVVWDIYINTLLKINKFYLEKIVKISNGSGIACKVGSYEIVVSASTTEGDPVTKKIKDGLFTSNSGFTKFDAITI